MPSDAGGAFLSADGSPLCPAVPEALDASGTDGSEAFARPAIKARRSFSSSACHSGSLSSICTLSSSVDSGRGSGSSSKKWRGTLVTPSTAREMSTHFSASSASDCSAVGVWAGAPGAGPLAFPSLPSRRSSATSPPRRCEA